MFGAAEGGIVRVKVAATPLHDAVEIVNPAGDQKRKAEMTDAVIGKRFKLCAVNSEGTNECHTVAVTGLIYGQNPGYRVMLLNAEA